MGEVQAARPWWGQRLLFVGRHGDRLPTGGRPKRCPEAAGVWFDLYVCGAAWGRGRLGGLWGRARGCFCGAACGETTVFERMRGCDCWTALPARSTTLPAPRPRVPEAKWLNRSPHGERGRVGRGQRLWDGGRLRGPWFSRRPASEPPAGHLASPGPAAPPRPRRSGPSSPRRSCSTFFACGEWGWGGH